MPKIKLQIPEGIDFSDLCMAYDSDGMVSFDWRTIEEICDANGLDSAVLLDSPEDNLAALINTWYKHHLAHGGPPDSVQEDIIAEARAEDALGGGLSYPPGSS
ncbi:MAG: hypothetical protein JNJ76_13825 [Candidatus Competibacter sp.]|nr:hypothetical protein [Candidatus Competibacter sp.]